MNQYEYLKYRDEFESFLLDHQKFFCESNWIYWSSPLLARRDYNVNYATPMASAFLGIYDLFNEKVDYNELCIYVDWSLGGTAGNCWDNKVIEVDAHEEPEFTQFHDIIKLIDPEANPLKFLNIIEILDEPDGDFYGGCITRRFKYVNLYKLFTTVKGYK